MLSFHLRSEWAHQTGLYLIIVIVLFSPLLEGGTTHLAAMILRLLLLAALAVHMVDTLGNRVVEVPHLPGGLPLLAFLMLATVSTIYSPYKSQSVQWLVVCLTYAGLLYLLVTFVEEWGDVMKLRSVLIVMGLAQALWALVQSIQWGMSRPTGTFFNPNFFAGYLAVICTMVLAVICYAKVPWRKPVLASSNSLLRSIWPLGVLAILLAAFFLAQSRGGTAALIIGSAVVILLRFGRRGLLLLCMFVVVVAVIPNPIRDRIGAEHVHNPESYARLQMWQSATREIMEHPLGVGLGLYRHVNSSYAFPMEEGIIRYGKIAQRPHNEYLQIAVELGVMGLGIFLWGIALVVNDAAKLLRQRLTRRHRALVVGLCAGGAVILVQACVDSNFHEPAHAVLLAFLVSSISLGLKLCRKGVQSPQRVAIQRPVLWTVLAALVLGIFAMYAIRVGIAYQIYETGNRLAQQQNLVQAIGTYEQAISLDPGRAPYRRSLAGAYFQLSRQTHKSALAQEAIAELQKAIALNPLDGRLHALLGVVAMSQVSSVRSAEFSADDQMWMARAAEAYMHAVELEPYSYAYRFELGQLMWGLQRRDRAEEHWRKVIELEPNYLPARSALVRLYAESGRREAAYAEYGEIQARQQRLSSRATNERERAFLKADATSLHTLLAMKPEGL